MGLAKAVFESQHLPGLFAGKDTHDAALKLSAQLVKYTEDDAQIRRIFRAALPPNYAGNTLEELPRMLESARAKGFDRAASDQSLTDKVIGLLRANGVTFFKDKRDRPFMAVPQEGGGQLNYELGSKSARLYVLHACYKAFQKAVSARIVKEVIETLSASALFDGERHEVYLRVGRTQDAVYIDLGRTDGLYTKITAKGWETTYECPLKFERRSGCGELPAPERGGSIRSLQSLLQLSDENFPLLAAFIINCLRPGPTFMCLFVEGEQGSGKSVLCEFVKRILDPNAVTRMRLPKDARDLMIQASAYFVLVFDNASNVKDDMSDALCSLATGGGLSTRELYTNDGLTVFTLTRPFIINGISDFVHRPDLMERAIPIKLPAMPTDNRKTEEELRAEFDALLPGILGAFYSIVAEALRNEGGVTPPRSIRMADVAKWLTAAEPGTDFPPGTLLPLLEKSQTDMVVDKVADLPLVMLLRKLLAKGPVQDTVGELFLVLLPERPRGDPTFPPTASHLSKELRRLKPALAKADIFLDIGPHRRQGRLVKLWLKGDENQPFRKLDPRY